MNTDPGHPDQKIEDLTPVIAKLVPILNVSSLITAHTHGGESRDTTTTTMTDI